MHTEKTPSLIRIGVSSCLLGNPVRHDGSHKRDRFITDFLAEHFSFVPFCPEVAIGLGTPRPTIRLQQKNGEVRLVESKDQSKDHTDNMLRVSNAYCNDLNSLSGYILKSKSPSCGMERVNLYNEKNMPEKKATGMFAEQLLRLNPNLPVEEEGRLHDAPIRENFIERVYAYHRWQQLAESGLNVRGMMHFHRQHKLMLLAHDPEEYAALGQLVATTTTDNLADRALEYIERFMLAMKKRSTRGRHVNVLQHSLGYLKKHLDEEDKRELLDLFNRYSQGEIPLVVPLTLLKYHFRKNPQDYIREQFYMNPYPDALMLRNYV